MKSLHALVLILLAAGWLKAGQLPLAAAPLPPDPRMKADILLIVAHPDDETAVGCWLARAIYDLHKKVAILYLNRGEGGGNSYGLEQSRAMGAIREIEARQAASALGIDLIWFLDGIDTPGQDLFHSLSAWGHGANLEKVVRLARLTRPEIILTWLPHYVAGENHGDHQAAGVLAVEAFDCAGDPTRFPAQVAPAREPGDINNFTEGLQPWQPKKILFFSDAAHPLPAVGPSLDVRSISPSRQVPYYQLAAPLHRPHRTQADVCETALQAEESGEWSRFIDGIAGFQLIFGKSVVPCRPDADLFSDLLPGAVPYAPPPGYRPRTPIRTLELGGIFAFYEEFWRAHGIEAVAPLVQPEVTINAGGYLHIPLLLHNPAADSVRVELTAQTGTGWQRVAGEAIYALAPGETRPVQTFLFAPQKSSREGDKIEWKAVIGGKEAGSVAIRVSLEEWTLPQ
ncbi:MAG TPA: PIG-L family deacetylase [bacterium]|nr:PIG-L family deacetylase [bacterium]HPR88891.1 PIG-L family deacetylase [bacterium]